MQRKSNSFRAKLFAIVLKNLASRAKSAAWPEERITWGGQYPEIAREVNYNPAPPRFQNLKVPMPLTSGNYSGTFQEAIETIIDIKKLDPEKKKARERELNAALLDKSK
jgi:hypothetical protein